MSHGTVSICVCPSPLLTPPLLPSFHLFQHRQSTRVSPSHPFLPSTLPLQPLLVLRVQESRASREPLFVVRPSHKDFGISLPLLPFSLNLFYLIVCPMGQSPYVSVLLLS